MIIPFEIDPALALFCLFGAMFSFLKAGTYAAMIIIEIIQQW